MSVMSLGEVLASEYSEGWAGIDDFEAHAKAEIERNFTAFMDHCSSYRQLFDSEVGRLVLKDLAANFLHQRIVNSGDGRFDVGIRQGQADVVIRILGYIEFAKDPDKARRLVQDEPGT